MLMVTLMVYDTCILPLLDGYKAWWARIEYTAVDRVPTRLS